MSDQKPEEPKEPISLLPWSRHVLIPAEDVTARYDTLRHRLRLMAKGEARNNIYDICFIPPEVTIPENPPTYYLKAWTGPLTLMTPYEHEQTFRQLQPFQDKVIVYTEGKKWEIDLQIVHGEPVPDDGPKPMLVSSSAPLFAGSDDHVITFVGGSFTIKEPIRGGSVNVYYDRDFLDLINARVNQETMYYEFVARKTGHTEITVFRTGRGEVFVPRVVDVEIVLLDTITNDPLASLEFLEYTKKIYNFIKKTYKDAKLLSVYATPLVASEIDNVSRLNNYSVLCEATENGELGSVSAFAMGGAEPQQLNFGPAIIGLKPISMPPTDLITARQAQDAMREVDKTRGFFSLDLSYSTLEPRDQQPLYKFRMTNGKTILIGAKDGKPQK